ncbi:3-oxo-5-alpha-steroid 4-dehydrogenase-domain-containing protein [Lyophyllum atratum]|nr:3-oxo-5-alpha-steroid 4-dehydrogenase-domain-containing protein [Lyophyllum atratum]
MFSLNQAAFLYNVARKYFTLNILSGFFATFFIDAPFGRFTPSGDSIFLVDGIKSWIVMELVSPLLFLYTFLTSPLSPSSKPPSLTSPQSLLAALYLIHYANRAILSPLRTPSRSKSHLIVPLVAVAFNTINGSLMGSYLSSPTAESFLGTSLTPLLSRPTFVVGIVLWAVGFAGNIYHDEILLDIRRKAQTKKEQDQGKGEHYAIPQGALYKYVSYPNYFCEWIEWTGFALAAAPVPFSSSTLPSLLAPSALLSTLSLSSWASLATTVSRCASASAQTFAPALTPPYIFLIAEVLLMLPRAVRGHQWYHQRFGAAYPAERKAVIPFLI